MLLENSSRSSRTRRRRWRSRFREAGIAAARIGGAHGNGVSAAQGRGAGGFAVQGKRARCGGCSGSRARRWRPGQAARKGKDVALILPDFCARIAVLDFDGFPADAKEQAALVRFRLKRSVPFDVETAALSYFAQPVAAQARRRGGGDGAARNRLALRGALPGGGDESRAGDGVIAGGAGTGAGRRADRDGQTVPRRAHAAGARKDPAQAGALPGAGFAASWTICGSAGADLRVRGR